MLELLSGERQVAPSVDGIRADHRARYEWVASRVEEGDLVVDAGCGVGYGSKILADAGAQVRAFDRSDQAIGFGKKHFEDPKITFEVGELYQQRFPHHAKAVVAFEVIEHLADPALALRRFAEMSDTLYVSVPNEDVFPFKGYKFHVRHYTKKELTDLLAEAGWSVVEWWGQEGPESEVEREVEGRTLVTVCERTSTPLVKPVLSDEEELQKHLINGRVPKSVAILGMGPSYRTYVDHICRTGGRWALTDETWVVNGLGGVLSHDRVFHMDDFKIQESRVENSKSSMVNGMMKWMAHHPHVYTSRTYPDYPLSREYPLEWVLNRIGVSPYFKGTPPYAVAFAIALGVEEIHLYGLDYHYGGGGNIEKRERGRACLEWWCGVAEARGIKISVPTSSSLMDQDQGGRHTLYGYDTEWITTEYTDKWRVARVPRRPEDIPDAKEMERRYSHNPKIDSPQTMPGSNAEAIVSPAA